MANVYSLPLPSSSEVNQQAHPGGGTVVTDASREGLVEDLFEAHMRHLDVATKSAVCDRLCRASNSLDGRGLSRQADLLDSIMVRFASGTSVQWTDDPPASADDVGQDVQFITDLLNREGESEEIALGTRLRQLYDARDWARMLVHIRDVMLSDDVLYGAWGSASEADMESELPHEQFLQYKSTMENLQSKVMRLMRSGQEVSAPAEPSRSKVQSKEVSALAARLDDMIGRYDSADTKTEDWSDLVTPAEYKTLYNDCLQKNPRLGQLNLLVKYQARLGNIRPSDVPGYMTTLDGLEIILRNFENYVNATNQRLIPSSGEQLPASTDYGSEISVGPSVSGGG